MTAGLTPDADVNKELLAAFLPEHTLDYFRVAKFKKDDREITIVLEEKNEPPPLPPELRDRRIQSKGFWNITVNDFPIRGRKVELLFRRRVWKVEGRKELLKRDIPLTAAGTRLEQEFAHFLKAGSRREAYTPAGDRRSGGH
jgi:hypothetical protein